MPSSSCSTFCRRWRQAGCCRSGASRRCCFRRSSGSRRWCRRGIAGLARRLHGRPGLQRGALLHLARTRFSFVDSLEHIRHASRRKTVRYNVQMMRKALALAAALVLGLTVTVAVAQSRRPHRLRRRCRRRRQLACAPSSKGATTRSRPRRQRDTAGSRRWWPLSRPRRSSRAASTRRRKTSCGRWRSAQPASDAALELGLLLDMLGRAEATPLLTRIADGADTANRASELARSARALRALGRFNEANAAYRDAATAAPRDVAIKTAWGEMFARRTLPDLNADALKSFQAALKRRPALGAGADRHGPRHRRRQPARSGRPGEEGARDQPVVGAGAALPRQRGGRLAAIATKRARSLRRRSTSTRRASTRTPCWRRLPTSKTSTADYEAEVAKAPGHLRRTTARSTASPANWPRTTTASTRRWRWRARRSRSTRRTRAPSPTSACTCCAPATKPARAHGARARRSRTDPFDVVTYNLLADDGHARQVRHRAATATLVIRMHKDEAPVLQEYAVPLAQQALTTLSKRYQFTPKGPILIEIFPKHDDFAVRNVGLPGMIGALGACFGRVVTMDSPQRAAAGRVPVGGDAVARAGARHHAADVQPARAALADRRHLGLRREAARGPSGAAAWTCSSRAC